MMIGRGLSSPVVRPWRWPRSIASLGSLMSRCWSMMWSAAAVVSASVSGTPCRSRQFRLNLVKLSQKCTQPQQIATKGFLMDLCSMVCPLWHYKSLPKSDLGKRSYSGQIQNGGNSLWNAWIIIIFHLFAFFWHSNAIWILIIIKVHNTKEGISY